MSFSFNTLGNNIPENERDYVKQEFPNIYVCYEVLKSIFVCY